MCSPLVFSLWLKLHILSVVKVKLGLLWGLGLVSVYRYTSKQVLVINCNTAVQVVCARRGLNGVVVPINIRLWVVLNRNVIWRQELVEGGETCPVFFSIYYLNQYMYIYIYMFIRANTFSFIMVVYINIIYSYIGRSNRNIRVHNVLVIESLV